MIVPANRSMAICSVCLTFLEGLIILLMVLWLFKVKIHQ